MQTTSAPRYNTDFHPTIGKTEALAPGIKRIVAPNPSAYTFTGTNTYIVGFDDVIVVDPGPDDDAHMANIVSTIGTANCKGVVLTHTHNDHAALAEKLAQTLTVPLIFEGPHRPSRKIGRFERDHIRPSCNYEIRPNLVVRDNSKIDLGELQVTVLTTPGHCANHIALAIDGTDIVLSGDHIMGWSSTLIADPDGSLDDYLHSLDKMIELEQGTYFPAHGDIIKDGRAYAKQLKYHREFRNSQIVDLIDKHPRWTHQLLNALYPDIPLKVKPAALLTLNAHLQYLMAQGKIEMKNRVFGRQYFIIR